MTFFILSLYVIIFQSTYVFLKKKKYVTVSYNNLRFLFILY